MSQTAAFLSNLEIGVETPIPMKYDGKQVYAKLINFGALPAPFGLRGASHNVSDIEWKQIAWEYSTIAKSGDTNATVLSAASTPALSGGVFPWRFAVNRTTITCNMLTNTDYREWDDVKICLLYTREGDGAEGGSLVVPGPEGASLVTRGNQLVWDETPGGLTREEVQAMINASKYTLCEFYIFRNPVLQPGFERAQGDLLGNAAELYPEAWAYLQSAEGQALCKTEEEWQAMTHAAWATLADGTKVGWNGVGGAPFFAPNLETGALRLPDLRGMYAEAAGFDSLGVGGVHGDAVRNIVASFGSIPLRGTVSWGTASGAVVTLAEADSMVTEHSLRVPAIVGINASLAVPVANKNAPRAYGVLPCVYLGVPR